LSEATYRPSDAVGKRYGELRPTGRVFAERVKEIVLLNERRLALTELKVKLQGQDQLTLARALQIIDEMLEENQ
jgi:hypothetical protein